MKLSRRSFLKVSAATGIGAAVLSGCAGTRVAVQDGPQADGRARPLAQGEWKPAGCAGCTSWCSKEAYVLNGRLIKIRGNARSKVNGAASCSRSHLIIPMIYDPDRIKQPLKRTNPKKGRNEDPGWEPITWNEAVGMLADKIVELRDNGEPHKFATTRGRYTDLRDVIYSRLPKIVGSPNNISHSSICAEGEKFGPYYTQGYWNYRDYDLERAKFTLAWGVDPLCSFRQVSYYTSAMGRQLERGMKMATIDPKYSNTAAKSGEWLPVIPGEDDALAVAMAHEILVTGGWSKEFVGDFTDGRNRFEVGQEVSEDSFNEVHTNGVVKWWNIELKDRTPEWAEPICGVPAAQIRRVVADMVAAAPYVVVMMGGGSNMQTRGAYSGIGVHALSGLLGSNDHEGGVITGRSPKRGSVPSPADYQDDLARKHSSMQKIDQRGYKNLPALKDGKSGGGVVANRMADAILSEDPYELKVVLAYWNNFAYANPGTQRWEDALSKLDFLAHAVTMYSEMSHFADVLLPATYHLGEQMSMLGQKGHTYTHYWVSQRFIEPVYDVKNPETELMWMLGEALAERGFDNFHRYLRDEFTDPETGQSPTNGLEFEEYYNKLRSRPIWDPAEYDAQGQHGDRFNGWQEYLDAGVWNSGDYNYQGLWSNMPTVTGKFEFYSETLKKALQGHADKYNTDIDDIMRTCNYPESTGEKAFVAHYTSSAVSGDAAEYPFYFIDAKKLQAREGRSANTGYFQEFSDSDQGDIKWGDCIKMNPDDAARLGLQDGEQVRVISTSSTEVTTLKTWIALRPGTVQKNFGQGHWAFGHNAAKVFTTSTGQVARGANNNSIMPAEFERLSGSNSYYGSCRVRIERA